MVLPPEEDNGSEKLQNGMKNRQRTILKRTVGSASAEERSLRLMMLGCEDNPPYGPTDHTATMFLTLICRALAKISSGIKWTVTIDIYRVQQMEYPESQEEWDSYDGILLPGSLSAAYAKEEWIDKLVHVIVEEVHGKRRKTFGICFGHQVYAHALQDGQAVECPAGMQAGRRSVLLTKEGEQFFSDKSKLELLFTHGDMVESLPPCAVRLGGTERVPVQAAAYFGSADDATRFKAFLSNGKDKPSPIAITFQAHPEYAEPDTVERRTFDELVKAIEKRGTLQPQELKEAQKDVLDHYSVVNEDSLEVMITVGTLFGWFPSSD